MIVFFQTPKQKSKTLCDIREQPFQNESIVVNANAGNSPQQGWKVKKWERRGDRRGWGMGRKGKWEGKGGDRRGNERGNRTKGR